MTAFVNVDANIIHGSSFRCDLFPIHRNLKLLSCYPTLLRFAVDQGDKGDSFRGFGHFDSSARDRAWWPLRILECSVGRTTAPEHPRKQSCLEADRDGRV